MGQQAIIVHSINTFPVLSLLDPGKRDPLRFRYAGPRKVCTSSCLPNSSWGQDQFLSGFLNTSYLIYLLASSWPLKSILTQWSEGYFKNIRGCDFPVLDHGGTAPLLFGERTLEYFLSSWWLGSSVSILVTCPLPLQTVFQSFEDLFML